jgi:hypothetical protein
MESYIQGFEDGGDDEIIIFFGETDPRVIEDSDSNYP